MGSRWLYCIIGANQAGKRARSLLNCISVTYDIKIKEQNKIETLPTNRIKSDLIDSIESYGGFESGGVSNVAMLVRSSSR